MRSPATASRAAALTQGIVWYAPGVAKVAALVLAHLARHATARVTSPEPAPLSSP